MTLDFDTIRLRDGRSYRFAGILESVRTTNGDVVRVDNEGAVRDSDQTNKTVNAQPSVQRLAPSLVRLRVVVKVRRSVL